MHTGVYPVWPPSIQLHPELEQGVELRDVLHGRVGNEGAGQIRVWGSGQWDARDDCGSILFVNGPTVGPAPVEARQHRGFDVVWNVFVQEVYYP